MAAKKEAAQHRDQDDGDPGGDERIQAHVPDDLGQRRDLEVLTGEFRFSDRYEGGGEPGDRGGGDDQQPEIQDDLHQDIERLHEPGRERVTAAFRRTLQRRATATESGRGSLPHLLRTHVAEDGSEGSYPGAAAHRHMVGDGGPHSDLAATLEVNRTDMQLRPHPSRQVDIGSGLDGDIVLDGEQVQRSGELRVVRAVEVVTHRRPEPPQHVCHERCAAEHRVPSGRSTEASSRPIHQIRRCILLHLG